MKKPLMTIIFMLLVLGHLHAVESLIYVSSVTYDGSAGRGDKAYGIAADSIGNIIVTGWSDENSHQYALTQKYNNDMQLIQAYQLEIASVNTIGRAVAVDDLDNIIVAGYCEAPMGYDWFTVKYNSALSVILATATYVNGVQSGDNDEASAVAIDSVGNIFVTGYRNIPGSFNLNYYTIKYDSDLNLVSTDEYASPGTNNDVAYAIDVDQEDNVYVTGATNDGSEYNCFTIKYNNSLVAISSITLTAESIVGAADYNCYGRALKIDSFGNIFVAGYTEEPELAYVDVFVIKYDSNLTVLSSSTLRMSGDFCTAYALDIDMQNNIIAAGSYKEGGVSGCLVLKYSNDLVLVSSATSVSNMAKQINAVTVDDTGNIFTVGEMETIPAAGSNIDYLITKYNGLPVISSMSPSSGERGKTLDVIVNGNNFLSACSEEFSGEGITINSASFSSAESILMNITVAADGEIGERNFTLINPDAASYTKVAAFEIISPSNLAQQQGDVVVLGSTQGRGTVNPDKGESVDIHFQGSGSGQYICRIFTLLGELVYDANLQSLGSGQFSWFPDKIASGIYIVQIEGPGVNIKKKVAILR